jgi:nitrogen-specific signal transduction histidine kinase
VNHIVQSHRGVMRVASSPEGSTFTMVLPIHGPSTGVPEASDIREPVRAGSSSR